jgi:hypothetical protein
VPSIDLPIADDADRSDEWPEEFLEDQLAGKVFSTPKSANFHSTTKN